MIKAYVKAEIMWQKTEKDNFIVAIQILKIFNILIPAFCKKLVQVYINTEFGLDRPALTECLLTELIVLNANISVVLVTHCYKLDTVYCITQSIGLEHVALFSSFAVDEILIFSFSKFLFN